MPVRCRGQGTRWDGYLGIRLADDNNSVLKEQRVDVSAEDFITTVRDDVIGTRYADSVPFDDLGHISDDMKAQPETNLPVEASSSFSGRTLVNHVWWWDAPESVRVDKIDIDDDGERIDLGVYMYDDNETVTKWSGDIRMVIVDSSNFEMYNGTRYVEARDFRPYLVDRTLWTSYRTSIPYDDIARSADRLRERPDGTIGRWMRVYAEFSYDGFTARQDPEGLFAIITAEIVPDALPAPNEAPVPVVLTEEWGREGEDHVFDASPTTDDLDEDWLRYEWSWGDGTRDLVTAEQVVEHVFGAPDDYVVELTVYDHEGASAKTDVTVRILPDRHPEPGEWDDDPWPGPWRDGLPDPPEGLVDGRDPIMPSGGRGRWVVSQGPGGPSPSRPR